MDFDRILESAARSLASLAPTLSGLSHYSDEIDDIRCAVERGYFKPNEDDRVRIRFAHYLLTRQELLELIDDLQRIADADGARVAPEIRLKSFAISYAAACLLHRASFFLVDDIAAHRVIQRKLNEGDAALGIPRKQFTAIYRSLTHPRNAWRLRRARHFARDHGDQIQSLAKDDALRCVVNVIDECEELLDRSFQGYAGRRLKYRWHSWRRRRASAWQQAMFAMYEISGRAIADIRRSGRVDANCNRVVRELSSVLQTGDVIVTHTDGALSNLFLPGYWTHAALHIGSAEDAKERRVAIRDDQRPRWTEPNRLLEARKDGVLFRPVAETISTEGVAIVRPRLGDADVAQGLSRALTHEGKLYDFDFDFFRSDRLVCTEVIYRAYDGLGEIQFTLTRRAGRPTLSAQDVLRMTVDECGFQPVAYYRIGSDVEVDPVRAASLMKESLAAGRRVP